MSEEAQEHTADAQAGAGEEAGAHAEAGVAGAGAADAGLAGAGAGAVSAVADQPQVRALDGEPVSDDMASAAAVAAVVAIRQVALAYAANQAAALDQLETKKHDRAGFNAPRRNVRRRLPQTWTQPLGR